MGHPPQLQFVSGPFFIAADKDRRKFLIFGGPWCAQLHSRQWSAKLEFSVRQRETHWSTRGSVELHKFRHIEEKYPEPLHRNSSGLFTNRCQTVVQAIFFNLDSFMPMESSISSAAKCITLKTLKPESSIQSVPKEILIAWNKMKCTLTFNKKTVAKQIQRSPSLPRDHPLRGADHHQQPCEESLLPGLGSEEGRMKREE